MSSSIDYTLPLDRLPDPLPIEPLRKPFDVTITPPGSKSITCRAYVLAALAEGESRIVRPLRAEDTDGLLKALCTLGAEARWEGDDVCIKGVAGRFPRGGSVNLGDGGTPTRFMIACACLAAEPVIVDGSKRMRERPIAEGVEMLRRLGATIEYVEEEGRLPVRVEPSDHFNGGELDVGPTESSQSISAMLLIASFLPDGLRLRLDRPTSQSYLELTESVLRSFGCRVHRNLLGRIASRKLRELTIHRQKPKGCDLQIAGDASSALYWVLAALIVDGSRSVISGIPHLDDGQPDRNAIEAIDAPYGTSIEFWDAQDHGRTVDWLEARSPCAIPEGGLQANCESMPDGSIALAIAASTMKAPSRLTGLRTLRVKETDRIAALANELRKVCCTVQTGEDWIEITPPKNATRMAIRDNPPAEPGANGGDPVVIETYNDHRMAMAFAVLGLVRPGLSIRNPACVAKSYPGFWKDFAKLYR